MAKVKGQHTNATAGAMRVPVREVIRQRSDGEGSKITDS